MSDTFNGGRETVSDAVKNIESSQNFAVWEIIGNFVGISNQYNF